MKVKVSVVQDSPVFFNKEESLQKLELLVRKCKSEGSQLVVFPESFIPGYPRGFSFGATIGRRTKEGRELYDNYYQNSIDLATQDKTRLEELAAESGAYLVIGVTEKMQSNGSLYCSMLYVSPTNGLIGVHRKINDRYRAIDLG